MAAPFTAGTQLGPYEIISKLGAGGMGEVYRARDTRLDRDVAIKILPDAFAHDPDRLARLDREAKLLASLNHPHIAAIYSLEHVGDVRALVMELVEGDTLDARMFRGHGMDLEEALDIAWQIAEGLEAAHAKGIIHRDLKPANIKVDPSGKVKLLDFGLAKAFGKDSGALGGNPSFSPTMAPAMTASGLIVGTAAYMSPEQARGRPVDARTDIWAFGCVLFELLTGKKLFPGETITDVLASVVRADPEWNALPETTPPSIRRLLKRCLQKDPNDRLHHIGDARLEIREVGGETPMAVPGSGVTAGVPVPAAAPRAAGWQRFVPWALAGLLAIVVAVLAPRAWRSTPASSIGVARLEMDLPSGVALFTTGSRTLAMSPDGTRLAFIGVHDSLRAIYTRTLDRFEVQPLRGTEGAFSCFFSPDGASLGFVTNSEVKKISLSDGLVVPLATGVFPQGGGAWTTDGNIVYLHSGSVMQVAAAGGAPKQLLAADAVGQGGRAFSLADVPSASVILLGVRNNDSVWISSLDRANGSQAPVVEQATSPLVVGNTLIFFRGTQLLAAPLAPDRRSLAGQPALIQEDVASNSDIWAGAAISGSGSLVYTAARTANHLVWVSRHGAEELLTETPGGATHPRISPDGRRLAVTVNGTISLYDFARKTLSPLTRDTRSTFPTWAPNGRRLYFSTPGSVRWVDPDGGGAGTPVYKVVSDFPNSISPDGKTLAVSRYNSETSADVLVVDLEAKDPQPKAAIESRAYDAGAQFSPDGRWMTYASDESGQFQVYLRPASGGDRRWQVSTDGGTHPVWNRNGRELFYRHGTKMMAVDVRASGDELDLSRPQTVFDKAYAFGETLSVANYDVSPDGQRFVMIEDDASANSLKIVLNWLQGVKAAK